MFATTRAHPDRRVLQVVRSTRARAHAAVTAAHHISSRGFASPSSAAPGPRRGDSRVAEGASMIASRATPALNVMNRRPRRDAVAAEIGCARAARRRDLHVRQGEARLGRARRAGTTAGRGCPCVTAPSPNSSSRTPPTRHLMSLGDDASLSPAGDSKPSSRRARARDRELVAAGTRSRARDGRACLGEPRYSFELLEHEDPTSSRIATAVALAAEGELRRRKRSSPTHHGVCCPCRAMSHRGGARMGRRPRTRRARPRLPRLPSTPPQNGADGARGGAGGD